MAEIVNLRTVRKRKARQKSAADADANRLKHGQPRAVTELETVRRGKAEKSLDQHQRADTD